MKKLSVILLSLMALPLVMAQEKEEEKKFGIAFSGFVKADVVYDTRQTYNLREGHFHLWPLPEAMDSVGKDRNDNPMFNMFALQSRLKGSISGPDAFGAKTSGVIEGDFFAQGNANMHLFRLRHAFMKLNWENTELLAGQYWNPFFVTGCFPGTIAFTTGTPFQSFNRSPQIRVTHTMGNLSLMGAVLSQRDHSNWGPSGLGSQYIRNSGTPDLHAQIQYATANKEAGTSFLVGAGVSYKTITPRLESSVVDTAGATYVYKVDESLSSMAAVAYTTIKLKPVTIKMQYRYGENISELVTVSGFAVKDTVDAKTGELSYTPLVSHTVWGEVHTNGKNFQVGIFGAYLKNLGTKEAMSTIDNAIYSWPHAANIESMIRVSPRLIWKQEKVRFALEVEYTQANYGKDFDLNHVAGSTTSVSNIRTMLSSYYFF